MFQGVICPEQFANCSGHITPWNTVLTCEENYDMFYGERDRKNGKIVYPSYTLGWEKHFPFPPEHYGWVVEIDPFTNKKRKLISLGRCAHLPSEINFLFLLVNGSISTTHP